MGYISALQIVLSLGEIQDKLRLKQVLLLLCVAEIFGEISFAVNLLLNDTHPFNSPTFKLLALQLVLLVLAILSQQVRAFFNQITDEKAILKN